MIIVNIAIILAFSAGTNAMFVLAIATTIVGLNEIFNVNYAAIVLIAAAGSGSSGALTASMHD